MSVLSPERIDEIVACISQERDGQISLVELLGLTKLMIESLQTLIADRDSELGCEVAAIAEHIEKTKSDLNTLPPGELTKETIPDADEDLRQVVQSTEKATETILASAEAIMAADRKDAQAYHKTVDEAVIAIFEACSFQDLTGQRIRRVVETLGYISGHIKYVTDVISGTALATRPKTTSDELLNGPLNEGVAISQSDADDLFDEIDDLVCDNVVSLKAGKGAKVKKSAKGSKTKK